MTREEIIDEFCRLRSDIVNADSYANRTDAQKNRFVQALSEEIQRLQTEIERQKLIDQATSWDKQFSDSERHISLADIKALPSVQSEQKWTPVIVKLPEKEEKPYWVCLDDGYQCECRWTNDMYGFGTNEWSEWGWHIMDKPQYSRVVAWMPLPEPFRPKEGE